MRCSSRKSWDEVRAPLAGSLGLRQERLHPLEELLAELDELWGLLTEEAMGLEVVRLLRQQAWVVTELLDEVEQPGELHGRHRHGLGGRRECEEVLAVAAAAGLALHPARLGAAGARGVVGTGAAGGRMFVGATLLVMVLGNVGHRRASSPERGQSVLSCPFY